MNNSKIINVRLMKKMFVLVLSFYLLLLLRRI